MYIIGVSKAEKREGVTEKKIFEEIIVENFPNVMKNINL